MNERRPSRLARVLWPTIALIQSAGTWPLAASGQCIDYGDYESWVGTVDTPGWASAVTVSGIHIYVADGSSGLQVVENADPALPRLVGSVDTPDWASAVAVSGSYAYIADRASGLQVVDVSSPTSPKIVGNVALGRVHSVAVSGDYVYMMDCGTGLHVVNVCTPASPEIVGSIDTLGYARGLAPERRQMRPGTGRSHFLRRTPKAFVSPRT